MANFILEYEKLERKNNCYYYNNITKEEIYNGINKEYYPKWVGWNIIDAYKKEFPETFANKLFKLESMNIQVREFYKRTYWDCMNLDNLPNQEIAADLFNHCVNFGIKETAKYANELVGSRPTIRWSKKLEEKLWKYGGGF